MGSGLAESHQREHIGWAWLPGVPTPRFQGQIEPTEDALTEIPEHLLKRSKARRAAIGGGDDAEAEGGEAAASGEGASAAPATTGPAPAPAAAAPAEPAPPPEPEPVRPEVAAYQNRRRVPYWALPVLAFLPLWAYLFQGTLEPPAAGEADPLVLGGEIYASQCAACHGSGGGGGVGPALGTVVEHWPDPLDHMAWTRVGSTGWPGDTLGVSDEPSVGGMPGFPGLSDPQLAEVVLYERVTHGGLDPESDDALLLIAIAEGETTFEEAGLGELSSELGLSEGELASP
jgi:mono/diheme cytochrome c family protein